MTLLTRKNNKQQMAEKAKKRSSIFAKFKFPFLGKRKPATKKDNKLANNQQKPRKTYSDLSSVEIMEEEKQIEALLRQSKYLSIYSNALGPKGTPDEIEKILYQNEDFADYSCYHDRQTAHYYANSIAGLGVVQLLLDHVQLSKDESITDIDWDSSAILRVTTNKRDFIYGNRKGQPIVNRETMDRIINLLTQQDSSEGHGFSKAYPLYNGVNPGTYIRVSATHKSVSPYGATLAIRVTPPHLVITNATFDNIAPNNARLHVTRLMQFIIENHLNIMISGPTGSGKTELQKSLVQYIKPYEKIVLTEDTPEMHLIEVFNNKNIPVEQWKWIDSWESGDQKGRNTITDNLKQALRNTPKWLMVAETRGAEAYEMFQAVQAGHAMLTTLHSPSNAVVPKRFAGMIQTGYDNLKPETLVTNFLDQMDIGIHMVSYVFFGYKIRYIDQIAEYVPISKEHPQGINVLFEQHVFEDGTRMYWTNKPTKEFQEKCFKHSSHRISKKWWPIYPKEHPVKELKYKDVNKAYRKHMQQLKAKKLREVKKRNGKIEA